MFMYIKGTIFVTELEEPDHDDKPMGRTGER